MPEGVAVAAVAVAAAALRRAKQYPPAGAEWRGNERRRKEPGVGRSDRDREIARAGQNPHAMSCHDHLVSLYGLG